MANEKIHEYVQDADGKPENTPAGFQLLTMLAEQLTR